MGNLGVELGCLADPEDEVPVTEHEPHPPREDVEPFESVMAAGLRLRLGPGADDLLGLDAARAGQRQHRSAVHTAWLQPDPRVTDLRRPDEVVQRDPVRLCEGEQQFQACANGWVTVDPTGATSVAGVWAAGNTVNPRAQVITAAGEGSAAAIAINNDLVDGDLPIAVANFGLGLPV